MEHRINLIQYRGIVIIIKRPIYPSTKEPKFQSRFQKVFLFFVF